VLVVVLAVGAYAVSRVRGIFGSQELPTYAGSMPADVARSSDPKRLVYEVFGAPGAVAEINYLDADGQPQQLTRVTLPWSVEVQTDKPSMAANIVAQGDADFISCRISANDEVKDERTSSAVSAYVYCIAKSA
jgi:MmpS family membrane protein